MPVRALLPFLLVVSGVSGQPEAKRLIPESDLFNLQWIADPQISPDGSQVVYTQVKVNPKKDGYDTANWESVKASQCPMSPSPMEC